MVIAGKLLYRESYLMVIKYIFVTCVVCLAGCRTSEQNANSLDQVPLLFHQEPKGKYGHADQTVPELRLHAATCQGEIETVKILLKHGAKVDEASYGEQTALHFAALNGNLLIAELLIDKGATVNTLDSENLTPLDCALIRGKGITFSNYDGRKAVAELLVEKGGFKERKYQQITTNYRL
ncbi:MAG: ankyrin repeat domain-containing protein [Verrucomicrobia bacterium]|nr:ankyrin repeat domain-containing protein [Verrucomicrobiota bacterium]